MKDEELLGEVEDILRTMPSRDRLHDANEENLSWFGRVSAFVEIWNPAKGVPLAFAMNKFHTHMAFEAWEGINRILILLHQARQELRMRTIGPLNSAIGHGRVFDYFDELRKIIELAKQDLFFIDPYIDAEFVGRYLPHVRPGVSIRLLAREKLNTLMPAVEAFVRQAGNVVSIRSAPGFHDRYLIVDKTACYQSGASFKDGAKTAPTTLTQITDAFPALLRTYEDLWMAGRTER